MAARAKVRRKNIPATPRLRDLRLGAHGPAVSRRLSRLAAGRFAGRLFASDPSIWSADPSVRRAIRRRLGWLRSAERMLDEAPALERFAGAVREAGIRHVVLLGMGGSSLCPEVLRRVFGPALGHPDLIVLDSTVPAAVRRVEAAIDPARTLYLVSSKSGTTSETLALEAYFWGKARRLRGPDAARRFAAITDPGTPLGERATARGYLAVFRNPEDIGGRYSALSYFGLVPAALLGIDFRTFLARAVAMQERCAGGAPPSENPGLVLGAALGELARAGRDKVVLLVDEALEGFELWIEQLVAESTGKNGRGLVPVPGGAPRAALAIRRGGPAPHRGRDRVGVAMTLRGGASDRVLESALASRRDTGPLLALRLEDRLDLGAAMLQWEVATAVAGAILRVNPFDEPNVAEAKAATEAILEARAAPAAPSTPELRETRAALGPFLRRARRGNYLALLAYLDPGDAGLARSLERARGRLAALTSVPVTLGYGPRYLHSTGQLHKGGPPTGLFLMLVPGDPAHLPVPGRPYDFETLKQAQAEGDSRALLGRGRRVFRLDHPGGADAAVRLLIQALPGRRSS